MSVEGRLEGRRLPTLPSSAKCTCAENPDADRSRFLVTERGVTLITPRMLGQEIHHLL
jgi:hypothetical protein